MTKHKKKKNKRRRHRQDHSSSTSKGEEDGTSSRSDPTRQHEKKKQRTEASAASEEESGDINNPLLLEQQAFLSSLTCTQRDEFFSCDAVTPEERADIWTRQADIGETLVNTYSWATPDTRALRILAQFSPIVEIGCGANAYWCRQMHATGIDVVGYDQNLGHGGKIIANDKTKKKKASDDETTTPILAGNEMEEGPTFLRRGGPEVLANPENSKRTLFLCYPDENDDNLDGDGDGGDDDDNNDGAPVEPVSLGSACLQYYEGEYVIHVGELYSDTTPTLSIDQAPWGRSSSPEFQQRLAAEFHCVLRATLPGWLHVRDTISVWKRSPTCTMVFAAAEDDENDQDEEVHYRHVPVDERLPTDVAAPAFRHLLLSSEKESNENRSVGDDVVSHRHASDKGNKVKKKKMKKSQDKDDDDGGHHHEAATAASSSDRHLGGGADSRYECPW